MTPPAPDPAGNGTLLATCGVLAPSIEAYAFVAISQCWSLNHAIVIVPSLAHANRPEYPGPVVGAHKHQRGSSCCELFNGVQRPRLAESRKSGDQCGDA